MRVLYTSLDTFIGDIYLAVCDEQLCAIILGSHAKEQLFQYLKATFPGAVLQFAKTGFSEIISQLKEYFEGGEQNLIFRSCLRGLIFSSLSGRN